MNQAETTAPVSTPTPEVVQIESLDQFVKIMTAWHGEKVQMVKHLLEVPEGSAFQVGEDTPLELSEATLAGFKLGVEMALMQLGELPFTVEAPPQPVAAG